HLDRSLTVDVTNFDPLSHFFFYHPRPPRTSPLFPYTTLFRSPLTVRVISVTSSGRSSIRRTISTTSGWFDVIACASCCISTVLPDRKSTRLNSSHLGISYAVFCLKKKKNKLINNLVKITNHIACSLC